VGKRVKGTKPGGERGMKKGTSQGKMHEKGTSRQKRNKLTTKRNKPKGGGNCQTAKTDMAKMNKQRQSDKGYLRSTIKN